MKLFESHKEGDTRIIKLLGLPLYELERNYITADRTQKFLGGIISSHRINRDYGNFKEKSIKFFRMPFLKRIDDGKNQTWYLFNFQIKKHSLIEQLKKDCLHLIDKKHDDVYIMNANSGEIYLFLTYIADAFLKKNGSKAPLFIATKKYHCDMIKMICPKIPFIFIKGLGKKIAEYSLEAGGFRFFMIFDHAHFKKAESEIKHNPAGTRHYFTEMLNRSNLCESDVKMQKIVLPEQISLSDKISQMGLNPDKFIFIAPEAQSCEMIEPQFWDEIINSYQAKGYDVFVNLMEDIGLSANYKSCFLSYSEAFALAKKAKKIVTLRSGFSEFLIQTNVPMDIIYTKFGGRTEVDDMSVEQVFSGYSITALPNTDKNLIHEYMYTNSTKNEITNAIVG